MQLLLMRSQKSSLTGLGAPIFVLEIRSELNDNEAEYVKKYRLGKEIIYKDESVFDRFADSGLFRQLFTMFSAKVRGKYFTVNDLVNGRRIECKDIGEMLSTEAEIKLAANGLYNVLEACKHFGGEEVITYPVEE